MQDLAAGMELPEQLGWRDLQERMEQRETPAILALWAQWVHVGGRAALASRATLGTEELGEQRAHGGSRADRVLLGRQAMLESQALVALRALWVPKGSQAQWENQGTRALQDQPVPQGRKVTKEKRVMWGRKGQKELLEKLADGASEARWGTGPPGAPADPRAIKVPRGWQGPRAYKDYMASLG